MSIGVSSAMGARWHVKERPSSAVLWQIITVIGMLVMRVLWSGAIFVLLTGRSIEDARLRSVIFFTLFVLVVYFVAFVLSYFQFKETVNRTTLIAVFGFGFVLSLRYLLYPYFQGNGFALAELYLDGYADISFLLRPEFLTTILIFLLWRKAIGASRHWIGPVVVGREMRIGMVMFLVLGFLGSRTSGFLPGVETVLFLFISLITMGSARISSLSFLRGGRGIPFERNWAAGVIFIAGGLITSAFLLGLFSSGPIAALLDTIFSVIYNVILRFVLVLLFPIIFVLAQIAVWLIDRFEFLLGPEFEVMDFQADLQLELGQRAEEISATSSAIDPGLILRIFAITLGVLLLFLLLIQTTRQMQLRRQAMAVEDQDRESLISMLPQALADALRRTSQELSDRLRRLSPRRRALAAERIRQIYAKLIELSDRMGSPRPLAVTPYEFLIELNQQFPGSQEDLDLITHAYVRIRYGELPESSREVQAIEEAWDRIETYGRELTRRLG